MTKQLLNKSTYMIHYQSRIFMVTLSSLHNTYCGNPRFEGLITEIRDSSYLITATYRFMGHYLNEELEAHWLVEYHYKKHYAEEG